MTNRFISDLIKDSEYYLARLRTVQAAFPNARYHNNNTFSDKTVNQTYTGFRFEKEYDTLYVISYFELPFTYKDKEETILVYSAPRRCKLAKISWQSDPNKKKTISFSRLSINMKNNKFKDDMLNSCKSEIMLFIKNNPGHLLDTKNLEPRLKKLLMFT